MKAPDHVLYLKQKFYKNRSPLARFLDAFAARGLFFLFALVFFSRRVSILWVNLLLSGIALSCFMILLHIVSRLRFESFVLRETEAVQKELFSQHLWAAADAELSALAAPLLQKDETLVLLRRVEKADGDAVRNALSPGKKVALLSTGGFTPSAEAFAHGLPDRIRLIFPEQLIHQGARLGKLPPPEAALTEMARRCSLAKEKRKRTVSLAFSGTFPGKYFFTSALLILLSFFTSRSLYYRLLALLSSSIAVIGAALSRTRTSNPPPGNGI